MRHDDGFRDRSTNYLPIQILLSVVATICWIVGVLGFL